MTPEQRRASEEYWSKEWEKVRAERRAAGLVKPAPTPYEESPQLSANAWVIIGLVGLFFCLAFLQQLGIIAPTNPRNSTSSTERTLRRVYESQGIKHDDKMIREDAKAIEQLHRDINN